MLTTESEAKTKRCQESFAAAQVISPEGHSYAAAAPFSHGYTGGGSYALTSAPAMCVGSACMAWRWGEWEEKGEYGTPRGKPTKGYCGKAGRP